VLYGQFMNCPYRDAVRVIVCSGPGGSGPSSLSHDAQNPESGPDKHVPPKGRRGTLVVPGKKGIHDPTWRDGPDKQVPPKSRRGTLVVPRKREFMIERGATVLTSRSLRKRT